METLLNRYKTVLFSKNFNQNLVIVISTQPQESSKQENISKCVSNTPSYHWENGGKIYKLRLLVNFFLGIQEICWLSSPLGILWKKILSVLFYPRKRLSFVVKAWNNHNVRNKGKVYYWIGESPKNYMSVFTLYLWMRKRSLYRQFNRNLNWTGKFISLTWKTWFMPILGLRNRQYRFRSKNSLH